MSGTYVRQSDRVRQTPMSGRVCLSHLYSSSALSNRKGWLQAFLSSMMMFSRLTCPRAPAGTHTPTRAGADVRAVALTAVPPCRACCVSGQQGWPRLASPISVLPRASKEAVHLHHARSHGCVLMPQSLVWLLQGWSGKALTQYNSSNTMSNVARQSSCPAGGSNSTTTFVELLEVPRQDPLVVLPLQRRHLHTQDALRLGRQTGLHILDHAAQQVRLQRAVQRRQRRHLHEEERRMKTGRHRHTYNTRLSQQPPRHRVTLTRITSQQTLAGHAV